MVASPPCTDVYFPPAGACRREALAEVGTEAPPCQRYAAWTCDTHTSMFARRGRRGCSSPSPRLYSPLYNPKVALPLTRVTDPKVALPLNPRYRPKGVASSSLHRPKGVASSSLFTREAKRYKTAASYSTREAKSTKSTKPPQPRG